MGGQLPSQPRRSGELLATAGVYDKARLRRLFDRMYSQLVNGLEMTVVSSIAEGITLRDGKIAAVNEYLDTLHIHDVWIRA
jgi:hypothetical protein